MEIIHRVGINTKKQSFFSEINKMGIEYKTIDLPGGKYKLIHFDIKETDPSWNSISKLIQVEGASDRYDTYFSDHEIMKAEWLRLIPTYEEGYPQPEDTWITKPINYTDFCNKCGIHKQESSFRIKKEPNLKNHDFMTFAWAYVVFCKPAVFKDFYMVRAQGFEEWEVLINKSNTVSKKISQLYVPNIAKPGLSRIEDLKQKICPSCGKVKYFSHMRGVMHIRRDSIDPELDFITTNEWFGGGGASAYREILISNRIARMIVHNKWKGIRMKVVELID